MARLAVKLVVRSQSFKTSDNAKNGVQANRVYYPDSDHSTSGTGTEHSL